MVGVTAPYQTDHTNPRNKNTEQDSVIRSGGLFLQDPNLRKNDSNNTRFNCVYKQKRRHETFAKETTERAKKQQGLPQYAPYQQLISRQYSEQGNLL